MCKIVTIAIVTLFSVSTIAAENEGSYLYRVTTTRAAPGKLSDLLDWMSALKATDYYSASGEPEPLVMRHSQGDQWDLLIIAPMISWQAYYEKPAIVRREEAARPVSDLISERSDLIAFAEDHFAYGPPFTVINKAFDANGFFHIEMFEAAAGKSDELLGQRRMENAYLAATGQTTNMIFRRAAGSDVDVFTIGFHESLEAFAKPASVSAEEKETAAKAAGFQGLADISFYLRSLITAHHDTLAVKVD